MKAMLNTIITATILVGSVSLQAATRSVDVNSKLSERVKVKTIDMSADRRKALVESTHTDLMSAARSDIATRDLSESLRKTFTLNEGGADTTIDMLAIAQSVRKAKSILSDNNEIKRTDLDANAAKLVTQLDLAVEITPKFMALASKLSNSQSNHGKAFVKQMSLVPEVLSKMSAEEVASHVEIMTMAVEAVKQGKATTAEDAYLSAIKAKFGDKTALKLEEIIGCAR
ncbi:MAG: hypothetical protein BroJett040_19490 [Oligoflexia bacterium]|nr:MAG: hypothetical protein BroJett040_19490 [Oligoflexia bacterium]